MSEFTLDALIAILQECAGEDDETSLTGDILDTDFEDLGYDSVALMETASRIETVYRVTLTDDIVGQAGTPRDLLQLVNMSLATGS